MNRAFDQRHLFAILLL